ncbi:uncharacterized protein [Dendropsophus ebraccatus]|uniref:uncharacterized protein n=1 Tax=Dendropsophus ebraccatus TaxID=150705 RepID=UPI003831733B
MPSCVIEGCFSGGRKRDPSVSLHVFPKNKEKIRLWLEQTGQQYKDLDAVVDLIFNAKKTDSYRVCSLHFADDSYVSKPESNRKKLRKNAIPTIFNRKSNMGARKKRKRDPESSENISTTKHNCVCPNCGTAIDVPTKVSIGVNTDAYLDKKDESTEPCRQLQKKFISKKIQCNRLRYKGKKRTTVYGGQKNAEMAEDKINSVDEEMFSSGDEIFLENTIPPKSSTVDSEKAACVSPAERDPNDCVDHSDGECTMSPILPALSHSEITDENPYEERESTSDEEMWEPANKTFVKDGTTFSETVYPFSDDLYPNPVKQKKIIVFESSLDQLIKKIPCQHFSGCKAPIEKIIKRRMDTFISVQVICRFGHSEKLWESQPRQGGKPLGDLIVASAVLLSGNTFVKVKQMFHLINFIGICDDAYYRFQRNVMFPTIDNCWMEEQKRLISELGKRPVCVVGDGQCDTPGHSAKYCVYSLMDVTTNRIISYNIQQLHTGVSSVNLEKISCKEALDYILEKNVNVRILCTDRNVAIQKMLFENYPTICHKFDIWHIAKRVGKKVLRASRKKNCQELREWISPVKNHLWFCSENCDDLIEKWRSLLYHIVNVHQWTDSNGNTKRCDHEELSADSQTCRKWLREKSVAYNSLSNIVNDPRLIKDVKNIAYFCHPGTLEVFHVAVSKYRPKRQHYFIDSVTARTQLAIMDHNSNANKVHATLKKTERYSLEHSKARMDWSLRVMYEPSNQNFLIDILEKIIDVATGQLTIDQTSQHAK